MSNEPRDSMKIASVLMFVVVLLLIGAVFLSKKIESDRSAEKQAQKDYTTIEIQVKKTAYVSDMGNTIGIIEGLGYESNTAWDNRIQAVVRTYKVKSYEVLSADVVRTVFELRPGVEVNHTINMVIYPYLRFEKAQTVADVKAALEGSPRIVLRTLWEFDKEGNIFGELMVDRKIEDKNYVLSVNRLIAHGRTDLLRDYEDEDSKKW